MNCFECGSKCVTKYHFGDKDKHGLERVIAVNKVCNACGWESFRTKVPEPLS